MVQKTTSFYSSTHYLRSLGIYPKRWVLGVCLLIVGMMVGERGWGQMTLATFDFESSNLSPIAGAIGSPTLTGSSTISYFGGSTTSPIAAASFASANGKYFELTISSTGYSSISVDWNARTSSTTSSWIVTADDGSGYGSTLATQVLSTSFSAASTLNLSSSFNNKATIKIRWTANVSATQTIRIDDIVIKAAVAGYTVNFNSNGGTGTMSNQTASTTTALTNNAFSRIGYTFSKWNTAADGSGTDYSDGANYAFTANVTLYAQWISAGGKTVTFNSNGGSGSMSPQNASTTTNLTANAFTRTGYTFSKWNTAANGSGTDYADGASYNFSADLTLYSIWTANNYTVNFNANSASSGSVPSAQNGNYSSSISLSGNTGSLARTGYTFTGWNTAADGSGTHYNTGASFIIPASNTTLYAEWTGTITYSGNGNTGGTAPSNASYFAGATVTVASNSGSLVKSGLTFTGWNTAADGSGTSYTAGSGTFTMAGNVTLYARWISGPCLSEDFEAGSIPFGWTTGGGTTAVNGSAGDYYINLNENGEWAQLPSSNTYSSISFNLKGSVASNSWTLNVQYFDGSSWQTISGAGTIAGSGIGTTYSTQTVTLPVATSNVRLFLIRSSNSAFIGDLAAFCYNGPEINLKQGSTSYATTSVSAGSDTYDFGNQQVSTSGTAVTFTIENTGTASLSLTGSPIVAKSGTNASEFTIVQATTSSSVAAGTNTTFTVAFNPSAVGTRTAVLSIANDDTDENPYVINIKGTGTYAATSTISENNTSYNAGSPATKIAYTSYQSTPAVGGSVAGTIQVFNFIINDVGGDGQPTILSSIKFTVKDAGGTNQISQIRHAVLATSGNSIKAVATNITATEIEFTGLPAADFTTLNGSTLNYILRVSYKANPITDNTKFVYKVSAATADVSGSVFAASDAGGAVTDASTDNRNRINVTGSQLAFNQGPSNASNGLAMSPAVTVIATDANNNQDLDFATSVSIACSTPAALTSGGGATTPINGVATFSSLVHGTNGTYTMTASASGYTNTPVSSSYIISSYVNGDWYTITGTGLSWGTANHWKQVIGGVLSAAGAGSGVGYPNSSSTRVFINGAMTTAGSRSSDQVTIESGGNLTISAASTVVTKLWVKAGGTLTAAAALTNSGVFEVEDNGNVVLQSYLFTNNSAIWSGTEIFHSNSNFIIYEWGANNATTSYRPLFNGSNISTNTYNGYTAAFGNISVDLSGSSESNSFAFLSTGVTANLAHGNVLLANPVSGRNISFLTSGTATSGIGGTLTVDDLFSPTDKVIFASAGNLTFTIKGNLQLDGATTVITTSSTAGTITTVSVEGDINITPAAVLDYSTTVAGGSPAPIGIINLKGDLTVSTSGLFRNSNTSSVGTFNFNGAGDGLTAGTTQTIDIASTSSNRSRYINFYVNTGAYVQLVNRDLELGAYATFTVKSGGTLDFYFTGTTANNIKIVSGATNTAFTSETQSTLKISSPLGIVKTANSTDGNVQGVPVSSRSFDQAATFHYTGKVNQVTGDAITTGSTAKVIICELLDNNTQLSFTNNIAISSTTTVDATYGGNLYIKKGQVIESATGYITQSSGTLRMEAGTLYYVPVGFNNIVNSNSDVIPRLSGSLANSYFLTGGTIEFAGSGTSAFQTIRGARTYYNVKFSGANTYGMDFKFLSSNATIDNSLIVTGSSVLDCRDLLGNATDFTGNGGLQMTGGYLRLKTASSTAATPRLAATNAGTTYSLTGGIVEFYGSTSITQQRIRGNYGASSTIIDYYNIEVNATAANYNPIFANAGNVDLNSSFTLQGTMNVNSPAVLRMDESDNIYKYTGNATNNVNIKSGAGLLYGSQYGITTSMLGGTGTTAVPNPSAGNIRTSIRSFSTGASYGFIGAGDMPTGSGLPTTVAGLYAFKTNTTDLVTFTNPALVSGSGSVLNLTSGVLVTTSTNLITLKPEAVVNGGSSSSFVSGPLAKQTDATNTPVGTYEFTFPIGKTSPSYQYKPAYILPVTTSGATTYTSEYFPANPAFTYNHPFLGSLIAIIKGYYWKMDRTGTGTARVALDYTPGSTAAEWVLQGGVSSPASIPTNTNVAVVKNSGSDWNFTRGNVNFNIVGPMYEARYYTTSGKIYSGELNSFSPFTFGFSYNSILPVKLLSFTGRLQHADGKLEWKIADARDLENFDLEYSRDGREFQKLATIGSSGSLTYNFLHKNLPAGINYYRLLVREKTGNSFYSQVVTLHPGTLVTYAIGITSANNGGQINAVIYSASNQKLQASITDVLGRQLMNPSTGMVQGSNQWKIETYNLPKALYFITLRSEDGWRETIRFVKE